MDRHLKSVFTLLIAAILVTTGLIAYREMNPEWKQYQRAYYLEESARVRREMAGADQARLETLRRRLSHLSRPDYRLRQILLDNGQRADRCVTCHLDLERLEKKHPQAKRFPFEQYGCTVCHGGVGRATEKARAHSTLRIPPRPLYEYLQARESKTARIDLFNFSADGRPIEFTGSKLCLRCHLGSHLRHVARWRQVKFKALDKVRDKLKTLTRQGRAVSESDCLACHTTGYNPDDGSYVEDRVTCESCHGPGGFYADLMAGGKAREGAELARSNVLETRSDRVCLNCHNPERHDGYLGPDAAPVVTAGFLSTLPAPEADGNLREAAWRAAPETPVPTWRLDETSGPAKGALVLARAVYDRQRLYFAFRWPDAHPQERMGRWVKGPSGWRVETTWPDAFALHWQASDRVADFKQGGCAVLCHTTGRFAQYPRMATRQEDAVVDEWYWNAFVAGQTGRPGDGFLDNRVAFVGPDSPLPVFRWIRAGQAAAHGSDTSGMRVPDVLGGLPLIPNARQKADGADEPAFRPQNGRLVPLDRTRPEGAEETLPLYAGGRPEQGDAAQIDGRGTWKDGYWTLELSRKLQTGSRRDVQFDPPQNPVAFGIAVWDGGAGDRHQVATLITLRFQAPAKAGSSVAPPGK